MGNRFGVSANRRERIEARSRYHLLKCVGAGPGPSLPCATGSGERLRKPVNVGQSL